MAEIARLRKPGRKKPVLVLGVLGADVHVVGIKILEYALRGAGFEVVNLGVMTPQEEFIRAALETDADAVLVSSLYGHAELDARGFRDKLKEAGIGDILVYIGGNLVVGKKPWEEVEKTFKDMGFDRVFPPGTMPEEVIEALKKDLGLEGEENGEKGASG